jgi:hypothetical protein
MSETKYAPEPDQFPKKSSNGSGVYTGYAVQARHAYIRPDTIAGMLLDTRWVEIPFAHMTDGNGVPGDADLAKYSLLTYPQAQSLRWWFIAAAKAENKDLCLETRIVKAELKLTFEKTFVSAHELVGPTDRSNLMPDWGKQEYSIAETSAEAAE